MSSPRPPAAGQAGVKCSEVVLSARGLRKVFDGVPAVDGVSFDLARGEILGLLGPNGAGKTTTIHLLLGLLTPTAGEVEILGLDLARHRRRILERVNFSSTYVALPSNLTVWENLNVYAGLYGVRDARRKVEELLALFEVPQVLRRVTGSLSSGQQTRVHLAKALLNDPEVLFLDEPTASLDPDIAGKVREVLRSIQRQRGVAMVYTSHNMAEVERMCDRVLFLARGRVVAEGTPEEVVRRARSASLEDLFLAIAREGELPAEGEGV
jgi:ABC-2 type transport system ATP-binding protein